MDKKSIYFLIIVALLITAGIWWIVFANFKTYHVVGRVFSVEGNYLVIKGFLEPLKNGQLTGRTSDGSFKVKLDSQTKITRIALHIPNTFFSEGKAFKMDDLPQERGEIDITAFKQDIEKSDVINNAGFLFRVKRSILNPFVFRASKIEYRLPIFE